jgi:hypothetical protein
MLYNKIQLFIKKRKVFKDNIHNNNIHIFRMILFLIKALFEYT